MKAGTFATILSAPPPTNQKRDLRQAFQASRKNLVTVSRDLERIAMEIQKREMTRGRILRLVDVIRMTGLSRSTLYNRIANREFPHQVSLGGRAVGWIGAEVEYWLNERRLLRPPETVIAEIPNIAPEETYSVPPSVRHIKREAMRPAEPTSCAISVNEGTPDLKQLHLMSANLYFDRSSQVFWLKLIPENKAAAK